jgi:hypothetical protein
VTPQGHPDRLSPVGLSVAGCPATSAPSTRQAPCRPRRLPGPPSRATLDAGISLAPGRDRAGHGARSILIWRLPPYPVFRRIAPGGRILTVGGQILLQRAITQRPALIEASLVQSGALLSGRRFGGPAISPHQRGTANTEARPCWSGWASRLESGRPFSTSWPRRGLEAIS